jgi:hypothetical protein
VAVLCDRLRIAPSLRWVRPFRRSATSSLRLESQHTRWGRKTRKRLKTGRRDSSLKRKVYESSVRLPSGHHPKMPTLARSFIVSTMNSGNRHRVWAWLLCALLFWLTANPPHCDLCDGVSFTVALEHPSILKHSHPFAPDSCNGICACCGFYGLPNDREALVPANVPLASVAPESPRSASVPRSTIFRPPRIVAS